MELPAPCFISSIAFAPADHDVPSYNSVPYVPVGDVGLYPPAAKAVSTVSPPATPSLTGVVYDPPNDHEEPFHSSESVN